MGHGNPVQKSTVFNILFEKNETLRFYHQKLGSSYSFFCHFSMKVTNKFCAFFVWTYFPITGVPTVKSSKCLTQNFDMCHRTDFGGFFSMLLDRRLLLKWRWKQLVWCWASKMPSLTGVTGLWAVLRFCCCRHLFRLNVLLRIQIRFQKLTVFVFFKADWDHY